mgnify:CR=1 FL=1
MPSCQFAGGPDPEGTVPAPAETSPALAAALYVVATPIGNLEDISSRAARTLRAAAWIAAEDTRSSRPLLQSLGIGHARCLALHAHNEESQAERVLDRIRGGESVALITDAGTPGISDPGALLVAESIGTSVMTALTGACYAVLLAEGAPAFGWIFLTLVVASVLAIVASLRIGPVHDDVG